MDLGIGVFLLIISTLLALNIYIIRLARDCNNRACQTAVMCAGKAALAGRDSTAVAQAAHQGLGVCGTGGYFIAQPRFADYSDSRVSGLRAFTARTYTEVHLPAPFLVYDNEASHTGVMTLFSTYELLVGTLVRRSGKD